MNEDIAEESSDIPAAINNTTSRELQREIDELKSHVSILEDRLRSVILQRDAAEHALKELREGQNELIAPTEAAEVQREACRYCEGTGVIWAHDFRFDCKRCGGTGFRQSASS